jgi:surface antigen
MSVPSGALIKQSIIAELKAQGLTQKRYGANNVIEDTGEITKDMEKIVDAVVQGIVAALNAYHTGTIVTVSGVQPGTGNATGTLV